MNNTTLPPHDIAAEQAILGALMSGTAIGDVQPTLTAGADTFFRPAHQTIYAAIHHLATQGAPTDPVSVKDALDRAGQISRCGGGGYLFELYQAATWGGSPTWHAGIVARHYRHRQLLEDFGRAHTDLQDAADPDHFDKAITAARKALDDAVTATVTADLPDPVLGLYQPLDWHEAFAHNPEDVDWLVEPFIEHGKSVAIYSPPKAGKSLLVLDLVAAIATGRPVFESPGRAPQKVMYIDIENTSQDVTERLTSLGYRPEQLNNLIYYSFPNLPALDSATGGAHLVALARHHEPVLVVIDTVSRVIEGSENDADTFASLYRHALAPLKGMGIAVIRLDHSGKDLERGQRGSSAKNADVDAVWLLVKQSETAFYLRREMSRSNHGVPLLEMRRRADPLRHELVASGAGLPPRVAQLVEFLEEMGVPLEAGRDAVRDELGKNGIKSRNEDISAAIKVRKEMTW